MSEYYKDKHRYDDMLDMPHHRSAERVPMSLHDRAAQFAPFAALSGHEKAIEETARLTDEKIILDETAIEKMNEKLYFLSEHLSEKMRVAITYFKPDRLKQGGAYLTDIGAVKKIDTVEQLVIMDSGVKIPMSQIVAIDLGDNG